MDKIIAMLLDNFKLKSPKTWAIIALFLTSLQYVLSSGTDLSVFQLDATGKEVLKWVSWAVALLMGSRTHVTLNGDTQAILTAQVEGWQKAHKTLETSINDLSGQASGLELEKSDLQKNYDSLKQFADKLEAQHDALLTEYANQKADIETLLLRQKSMQAVTPSKGGRPSKRWFFTLKLDVWSLKGRRTPSNFNFKIENMQHIANIRFTEKNKTVLYPIVLPESWEEFLQGGNDGIKTLDALLKKPVDTAQTDILRGLLSLPKKVFNQLADEDIALFLSYLAWLRPDASPFPMFPNFTHKGKIYHLPKPKLENARAREFELADSYFNKAVEEKDPKTAEKHLIDLVATLCREENPNPESSIERSDVRIPLVSRADVERRAFALDGLSDTVQVAVFLYFMGCKKYISDLYGSHIFAMPEPDDTDTEGVQNEVDTRSTEPFGWTGVFMELAENPVNLPTIYDMNIHTLCVWLMRRKLQNDRIREQTTAPTFKNTEE